MSATFFASPLEFRKWLEKHHKKETELLVGFYKVGSNKPSITWSQSVDQALCFGWIDSVRRSIDSESYCIRFTPRKTTSIWSGINIKKVEELTKLGLMKPEGIKAFELLKQHKSRIYAYEKEPTHLKPEYERQFKKHKKAWAFFSLQAPSYKRVILHWIMSGKQEKTRLTRLEKTILKSEAQKHIL